RVLAARRAGRRRHHRVRPGARRDDGHRRLPAGGHADGRRGGARQPPCRGAGADDRAAAPPRRSADLGDPPPSLMMTSYRRAQTVRPCPQCGHGLGVRELTTRARAYACDTCGGVWLETGAEAELLAGDPTVLVLARSLPIGARPPSVAC